MGRESLTRMNTISGRVQGPYVYEWDSPPTQTVSVFDEIPIQRHNSAPFSERSTIFSIAAPTDGRERRRTFGTLPPHEDKFRFEAKKEWRRSSSFLDINSDQRKSAWNTDVGFTDWSPSPKTFESWKARPSYVSRPKTQYSFQSVASRPTSPLVSISVTDNDSPHKQKYGVAAQFARCPDCTRNKPAEADAILDLFQQLEATEKRFGVDRPPNVVGMLDVFRKMEQLERSFGLDADNG